MVATAAGFVMVSGFSFLLVTFGLSYAGSGDPAHDATAGCAVTLCGPTPQAASAIPDFPVSPTARPSGPASRHHRRLPTPAPSSGPTRHSPAPAPPAAPVKVTFTADKRWGSGFEGELTISNSTSAAISAWTIAITLPGDRVTSVWNADDRTSGDVLILEPTSWDPPIPPGGHEHVYFVAQGPTAAPTSCTYNGAACG
jgi:Cellulose binding domain